MLDSSFLIATLAFAGGAFVRGATATAQEIRPAPSCEQLFLKASTQPIDRGNLIVPLDRAESNSPKTLGLRLLKIPTTKQPADRAIIVDFGRPGISGRMDMATTVITGDDVISFPTTSGKYTCHLLLVDSEFDVIVPAVSAKNMSASFEEVCSWE